MARVLYDVTKEQVALFMSPQEAAALWAVLTRIGPETGEEVLGTDTLHDQIFQTWFQLDEALEANIPEAKEDFMPFLEDTESLR